MRDFCLRDGLWLLWWRWHRGRPRLNSVGLEGLKKTSGIKNVTLGGCIVCNHGSCSLQCPIADPLCHSSVPSLKDPTMSSNKDRYPHTSFVESKNDTDEKSSIPLGRNNRKRSRQEEEEDIADKVIEQLQHDGLPHCTTNNAHSSPIIQNNESIIAAVYPRGTNSPTKSKKNDVIFQSSRSPLSSLHNSTKIHRHDSNKSARRKLFSSGNYDSNNSSSSSSTLFSLPHQSLLHGIFDDAYIQSSTIIIRRRLSCFSFFLRRVCYSTLNVGSCACKG